MTATKTVTASALLGALALAATIAPPSWSVSAMPWAASPPSS